MIKIKKSTKKGISALSDKLWGDAITKHYGSQVSWIKKDFIFNATENQEIIGIVEGKFEAGVLYINDLAVSEDYRGKGIGKALLKKAEDFGKKMGAHKAHLITGKGWDTEEFYKKFGYIKIADLPNHYLKKDFVIYEKIIV